MQRKQFRMNWIFCELISKSNIFLLTDHMLLKRVGIHTEVITRHFWYTYKWLDCQNKVIGNNINTSVYDKRGDFGFPTVNFPWLSGDVPRLPSYGIYISQLVRFARCCASVFDFILIIIKSLQNYWHRHADITSFEIRLESSLGHTLNFCPNLVQYRFKNMFLNESLTRSSTAILSTN